MNKNITIINMEDSERIRVTVHSEDSIKLVKLLADAGFIDYNFEDLDKEEKEKILKYLFEIFKCYPKWNKRGNL